MNRYYSSTAAKTVLSGSITDESTEISVDSTSGFPGGFPYTLILEKDTASEELVEVTNTAGLALIVTRGIDGTTARAHAAGSTVEHGVSALDFRASRQHENASANVHGLGAGAQVVGTTSAQEISNKILGTDLDAAGHTVKNLADPADSGDPVPLGWLMEQESNAASAAISAAASASAAAASETNAAASEGNAEDWALLAEAWAVKMDGPVEEPDQRSAKWYAQRPPTAFYAADPPTGEDYPGGLRAGDLWVESDIDTEEFDPIDFENRLQDVEGRGLADLPDVDASGGLSNGDMPVWNASAGKFLFSRFPDPRYFPNSYQTSVHEFNGEDMSAWTRVDRGSAGNISWVQESEFSTLVGQHTAATAGGDGIEHACLVPLSAIGGALAAGESIETCMDIIGPPGAYLLGGLMISSANALGSGNQATIELGMTDYAGDRGLSVARYTGFSTRNSVDVDTNTAIVRNHREAYFRIRYTGTGTTYAFEWSNDGHRWVNRISISLGWTPTHVGYSLSTHGSATALHLSSHFLRRGTRAPIN